MQRTTDSLPDQLQEAVERYRRCKETPPPPSTLVQTALEEFLARRGHDLGPAPRQFRITPAAAGSGAEVISTAHDRDLTKTARQE